MTETAIRHPRHGKAHRETLGGGLLWIICGMSGSIVARMTERIPIDQVPPDDRCRRCWPKEEA